VSSAAAAVIQKDVRQGEQRAPSVDPSTSTCSDQCRRRLQPTVVLRHWNGVKDCASGSGSGRSSKNKPPGDVGQLVDNADARVRF